MTPRLAVIYRLQRAFPPTAPRRRIENTMKTPRTQNDIRNDPRVEDLAHDGEVWDCLLKDGFKFDGERRISVGTIASICSDFRSCETIESDDTPRQKAWEQRDLTIAEEQQLESSGGWYGPEDDD